ncbi:MAG: hypothetical protein NT030_07935 [Candidatus Saganbacteria bacterium]|nr:hypothetical protein [Candidatus Saganbacteria bacterium]
MDFSQFSSSSIFIGIGIGILIYTLISLVFALYRSRKAKEEVKRMEKRVVELRGEIEEKRKELQENINKFKGK